METIWRLFRAAIIATVTVMVFAYAIVTCFFAGAIITHYIAAYFGFKSLAIRIPLVILFAVASGYIILSILLGFDGYFDEAEQPSNVRRGTRLGKADDIRGRIPSTGRFDAKQSIPHAANNMHQHGLGGMPRLVLALFTLSNWIPSRLRFWDRGETSSSPKRSRKR
ncbi:MAG: hypothetical protein U0930_12295 [Pirellulales bacterium]